MSVTFCVTCDTPLELDEPCFCRFCRKVFCDECIKAHEVQCAAMHDD